MITNISILSDFLSTSLLFPDQITPTSFEKSIISEINEVRRNPKNYFLKNIKDRSDFFRGTKQEKLFNEHEGYKSLEEDINSFRGFLSDVFWLQGMYACAKKHCNEQLDANTMSHNRINGKPASSIVVENHKLIDKGAFGEYLAIDGNKAGSGENISVCMDTAKDIVIQFLLDDNQPLRGHRKNILNPDFKQAAAAFGKKEGYTAGGTLRPTLCVVEFGYNYKAL